MIAKQIQVLFFAPLRKLEIEEPLGRGDKLDDTIRITNDVADVIKKLPPETIPYLGRLEYESLMGSKVIAYSEKNILLTEQEIPTIPGMIEKEILTKGKRLQSFLNYLWLVKDNAAGLENAFVLIGPAIQERFLGPINHAINESERCAFTRGELSQAREAFRAHHSNNVAVVESPSDLKTGEVIESTVPPLTRAMFYLSAARSTFHQSVRIANYCSALESLLLTESSGELTFRLSQRVAWLLGETPSNRKEIFSEMTAIYRIRSTAVHGSTIKKSKLEKDLSSLVVSADRILRQVFHTLCKDPFLAKHVFGEVKDLSEYEKYLQGICLGVEPESMAGG